MKKILAMLLALTMVFSLGTMALADGDKTELNVIISQYGNNTQEWWDDVFVPKFTEAHPEIDLTVEIVSWNDLYTVVANRITNDNAPDILNIDTFADYVPDDLLMPAEEYTSDELKAKIIPSFWDANELDGTVWALPILASVRALFYNKDILEAAGVEVPTTWDEVKEACAKIQAYDPDIIPWSLDVSSDEGQAAFAYYTVNNGGGFMKDGEWILNCEENVEALNFIKEMVDAGYCYPDPMNATRYPQQDAFAAGSLAMMIGPCNLYDIASGVNFGIANIPTNGDNESLYIGVCDRLMAFKDDDAPDQEARTAAISAFFDFFYETDLYSEYMVYEGFLPATIDSSELLVQNAEQFNKCEANGATPGNSEYFDAFCFMLTELTDMSMYPSGYPEWIDVKQGVIDAEQQVLEGADAQEILDALQEDIAG